MTAGEGGACIVNKFRRTTGMWKATENRDRLNSAMKFKRKRVLVLEGDPIKLGNLRSL